MRSDSSQAVHPAKVSFYKKQPMNIRLNNTRVISQMPFLFRYKKTNPFPNLFSPYGLSCSLFVGLRPTCLHFSSSQQKPQHFFSCFPRRRTNSHQALACFGYPKPRKVYDAFFLKPGDLQFQRCHHHFGYQFVEFLGCNIQDTYK